MIRFEFRGNPTLAPAKNRPGLAALIADITAMSGLEGRGPHPRRGTEPRVGFLTGKVEDFVVG